MNILGFYANTKMLEREEVFRHFLCGLSKERQQKIEAIKVSGGRRSSLGAWVLADYGLRSLYGLRERELCIGYGAYGKPYVQDEPDIHFNLSHSGDYVLAAFASAKVGCDIQKTAGNVRKERVSTRYFTEKERRAIAAGMDFYRIWARKESYIKCTGDGMSCDLRSFDVVADCVTMMGEDKKKYFAEYGLPGYVMAVCYENHEELPVVWREVRLDEWNF